MSNNDAHKMVPKGFFQEIGLQIKLVLRLLRDRRISLFLKALPIGTLVYLIVPDLVIGPFDDAAIVGLGLFLFVELCPQPIVEEHRLALLREMQGYNDPHNEVIEGKFQDLSSDPNATPATEVERKTNTEEGV